MDGAVSAAHLLALYERGAVVGPAARAALLCAAAGAASVDDLTLGDVDRHIHALRRRLFQGPSQAMATCSACGAALEFTLPQDLDLPPRAGDGPVMVRHRHRSFAVRLPRLSDLGPAGMDFDALCPGAPWSEPDFVDAVETALEQADPGLRLSIGLVCHDCATAQQQSLDIGGFLWAAIEQAARRLVRDTATLARAFGWSEAEITAMSPQRRRLYLAEVSR